MPDSSNACPGVVRRSFPDVGVYSSRAPAPTKIESKVSGALTVTAPPNLELPGELRQISFELAQELSSFGELALTRRPIEPVDGVVAIFQNERGHTALERVHGLLKVRRVVVETGSFESSREPD
jgi:hypothetical protein